MELLGAVASWYVATGREPTSAMKVALTGLRFAGKSPVLQAIGELHGSAGSQFHPVHIVGMILPPTLYICVLASFYQYMQDGDCPLQLAKIVVAAYGFLLIAWLGKQCTTRGQPETA